MERYIAEKLLEIGAVALNPKDPFIWSSGIVSPVYCDNRLTMAYPNLRKEIAKGLVNLIENHFPETEGIAGTATAGIPHAAWVSAEMNLPMCYVRSKPKSHGKGNQIEGLIKRGQRVVVLEDLISTGKSSLQAAEALREAGANVVGVVSIFTYELEEGKRNFLKAGLPYYSLSRFTTLIKIAKEKNVISERDEADLLRWKQNQKAWR